MTAIAALVGINTGYLALAFLPPIIWLLFYLREDAHPEPKLLLLLSFVGGMISAIVAVAAEILFVGKEAMIALQAGNDRTALVVFLAIALIEEYAKYAAIKFLVMRRKEFDEPVDAMIYMMTAALGFAALENVLFTFPLFRENLFLGLEVATNRFLGANLLHALSSGIVGFFLARAFFSPHRHYFVGIGIIVATVLHALFNYLILIREAIPQGTFYIILLLSTMAVMVLIDFERLKGKPQSPKIGV